MSQLIKVTHDCNRCNRSRCEGSSKFKPCPDWVKVDGKFTMAEVLLSHPQTTHDALTGLPFKVNLDFYLEGR